MTDTTEENLQPVVAVPKPHFDYMSVQGGGGKPKTTIFGKEVEIPISTIKIHQPVHEQMTMAALILSDFKLDPTISFITLRDHPLEHTDLNDFIRGVLWNDDPECQLFDENNKNSNLEYSTGAVWGAKFFSGKWLNSDKKDLIGRSHFGDLQWLHAMGSIAGEPASVTKERILRWMQTMYGVAVGSISPNTRIGDTWLREWFLETVKYATVGELLMQKHKSPGDASRRALGSCFHIIQDSYAIGHTRRELLNPQDRLPGHDIKFKNGVADRWGAVLNFHTYRGQSDEHGHYDHSEAEVDNLDLRNPDAWNGLVGCRMGVDACVRLANYWHHKAPWEEVHAWLDTEVLRISESATPSDNSVV